MAGLDFLSFGRCSEKSHIGITRSRAYGIHDVAPEHIRCINDPALNPLQKTLIQFRAHSFGCETAHTTATMATAIGATLPLLRSSTIIPRLSASTFFQTSRPWSLESRQLALPLWSGLAAALPAIRFGIPALLGDIWESILRAVPKKKTTHSKKRSRLLAGKALQDVTAICKCPACGQPKRRHVVCPHCAAGS